MSFAPIFIVIFVISESKYLAFESLFLFLIGEKNEVKKNLLINVWLKMLYYNIR